MAALAIYAITTAVLKDRTDTEAPPSGRPRTVCRRPRVLRRWQSAAVLGFGTKRPEGSADVGH